MKQGDIVTLIGANGAGKTTTLRTISGLLRARIGEVIYEGETSPIFAPHRNREAGIGPRSGRAAWFREPDSA